MKEKIFSSQEAWRLTIALCGWLLLPSFAAAKPVPTRFSTPLDVVRALIKAGKTGDATLWAKCLSARDLVAFRATHGPDAMRDLERLRQEYRAQTGRLIGRNAYEFGMFQPILPFSGAAPQQKTSPFGPILNLAHIRREAVWGDTYAEVTVVLPVGSVRLMLLKEKGSWKLAQTMTFETMSGAIQVPGQLLDDSVDFVLFTEAGIDFKREDCRRTRVKEFVPGKSLSRKFAKAYDSALPAEKPGIWAAWHLTGDPAAAKLPSVRGPGFPVGFADQLKRQDDAMRPCAVKSTAMVRPGSWRADPSTFFRAAYNNPVALRALIERFPDQREWVAKTLLRLADLHAHSGTYLGNIPLQAKTAVEEYQAILDNYSDQPDVVVQAKTSMARLYWDQLGERDKAMQFWKELKAIGKLPPDTPLARGARTTPTVLIRDTEKGYGFGVNDFILADDGSLYVSKGVHQTVMVEGKPRDLALPHILHYSSEGAFISTFTQDGLRGETIFSSLGLHDGRPYLLLQQKIFLLGRRGEWKGELVNEFNRFQFFPDLQTFSGMGSTMQVPLGFYLDANSFEAFYPDAMRTFDYSGKLLSKIDIPYCNRWEPNMVRIAKNSKQETIVAEPACGVVLRLGPDGVRSRITTGSKDPQGAFTTISDMYVDGKGNSYILDAPGKLILKFDRERRFVSQFHSDAIDGDYSHIAADDKGRVYVFGRPATFQGAIMIFDASGQELRRFAIDYSRLGGMHKEMVDDLEVSGDKIYAAIDRYLAEYDLNGNLISHIDRPVMGYGREGMRLAKDPKGRIAFMDRGQIFELSDQGAHLLADLRTKPGVPNPIGDHPSSFGFNADGSLVVAGFGGIYRYDVRTKIAKLINPPKGVLLQNMVASPAGGILAWGYQFGGRPIEAWRLSGDGAALGAIQTAQNAKQYWQPSDVVVEPNDDILIYDQANKSLLRFDPEGKPDGETSLAGYTNGRIQRIRLDRQGHLYMLSTEMDANVIRRLNLADLF